MITRILGGFDEEADSSLDDSLGKLKEEVSEEYGLPVALKVTTGKSDISPEVRREVVSIVREATMNAARHSGTDKIKVEVMAERGRLIFSVIDYGSGIDRSQVTERQAQGGMGITNMHRRAEQIGGELRLENRNGGGSGGTDSGGTAVELAVPTKHSGIFARMLEYDPGSSTSGIYPYLIRLRTFMFAFTAVVFFMQPSLFKFSLPNLAVGCALALDCLAWVLFRSPLYRLLRRSPWLLVLEQLYFSAILIMTLRADMPFFFSLYLGVTVIMNGLFLGPISNFAMTTILNAGLFIAH
ncbi:MAG: ATP-binding protein, partial [Actinomycetota bacterium]